MPKQIPEKALQNIEAVVAAHPKGSTSKSSSFSSKGTLPIAPYNTA